MDDEAAFIETIRLHPNDDTPRLIYADWLDERGDPRAEYLRLTARIAQEGQLTLKLRKFERRFRWLSKTLDRDWVGLVGRRYDLVLLTCKPEYMVGIIKTVRKLTGLGLRDAKLMAESRPCTVVKGLLLPEAWTARFQLINADSKAWQAEVIGGFCEAELRPAGRL